MHLPIEDTTDPFLIVCVPSALDAPIIGYHILRWRLLLRPLNHFVSAGAVFWWKLVKLTSRFGPAGRFFN